MGAANCCITGFKGFYLHTQVFPLGVVLPFICAGYSAFLLICKFFVQCLQASHHMIQHRRFISLPYFSLVCATVVSSQGPLTEHPGFLRLNCVDGFFSQLSLVFKWNLLTSPLYSGPIEQRRHKTCFSCFKLDFIFFHVCQQNGLLFNTGTLRFISSQVCHDLFFKV